jgi:hypothetical protein
MAATLVINGLAHLESDELMEELPPGVVAKKPESDPDSGMHGEPILITLAILAIPPAVHALAAWLARRSAQPVTEPNFTVSVSDGTVTVHVHPATALGDQPAPESVSSEIAQALQEALRSAAGG